MAIICAQPDLKLERRRKTVTLLIASDPDVKQQQADKYTAACCVPFFGALTDGPVFQFLTRTRVCYCWITPAASKRPRDPLFVMSIRRC
jgi:hypothetical protein